MLTPLRFYISLHFFILFMVSSFAKSIHDDRKSLWEFKSLIAKDPQHSMANWSPSNPLCNWTGITCTRRHQMDRVIALNLTAMDLQGPISPSLGNLSFLRSIVLTHNALHGSIPPQLGRLFRLRELSLPSNQLQGSIPRNISNCHNLVVLDLSFNTLTGNIPVELGLLTNLQLLYLQINNLSGKIPASLSNISSLTDLEIAINNLTGHIPSEFGKLNQLTILSLWNNQLSGNIPISIGNCSKLVILDLSFNYYLQGIVPIELGKLSFLQSLNLGYNQFESGGVTMPFITALINCSRLQKLRLGHNKLSGVLPSTIGKLSSNLSLFALFRNRIEGNIPFQISNLSSLTLLNFSGNIFNGSIPSLQSFVKLERLDFGNNKLEGKIPNIFKPLKHLGLLDLSRNRLSGRIPNSLFYLQQLRMLYLHHNFISGQIPATIGECTNLALLDLSHNRLSGSIPHEISGLYNLQFYLDLSWNLLEGSLPSEISKIVMGQAIDVSGNQITGLIPTMLGSCLALQSLNLSRNAFQGSIPDSLGNLQNLMFLDLSSNSLSGTIPITFKKLKMLQSLNLSFNKLTGEVSKGEFSINQTISLTGNPGICGIQELSLHSCPASNSHVKVIKMVLLPILGVGFLLCCLLLSFLWRGNLKIPNFSIPLAILQKVEHRRISYQELFQATNGFNEANLLGKGSFGSVYKGTLTDGTLLAVKVLNLQNAQAENSFEVECKVLQNVRHRNLVRIITSCSNPHFKGLVFEFMCNGSLERHLYLDKDDNNDEQVCELGLQTRLSILIDVAHAMEYLHHDSPVQVVHCDIKPSNVLLDEDMLGHVTDFGIARLIGATSIDSLASTLSLKGSIGYIAPEYGLGGTVSIKGDVYSYGIMLLEMLTKMAPTSDIFVGGLTLHTWVNSAFPSRLKDIIDNSLLTELDGDTFEEDEVYKCLSSLLSIGLCCSKDSPEERPTMRDVALMLKSLQEDLVGKNDFSKRPRQCLSNLLRDTSATRNVATTSNDQSSSTF